MKINHQIYSLQFQLNIPFKKTGFEIQQRLDHLCQDNILGILEKLFNQIDQPQILTCIDCLELDIGIVNLESFEADICEKLADNIYSYFKKIQIGSEDLGTTISQVSLNISLVEQLGYFLKTGQLPWNAEAEIFQDFDNLIIQLLDTKPDALKQLWQQSLSQTSTRQRLIFNLQESTLELLVLNAMAWTKESWHNLKQIIFFLSNQLTPLGVSSSEKLIRWDNLMKMISVAPSVEIQVCWEQWLQQQLPATSFIPLGAKSQIWLTFRNAVTKYIASQSSTLPSWLQETLIQHLEKINQQLSDSSFSLVNSEDISEKTNQSKHIVEERNDLELGSKNSLKESNSVERQSFDFKAIDRPLNNVQNLSNAQGENDINSSSKSSKSSADAFKATSDQNKRQAFPAIFSFQNEKACFINNSGLVLLWPYLPRYLQTLNYVQNNQFMSSNHQLQAVHSLEHLVRGEEDYREYDLVLNKVLLGLPLPTPVDPELGKISLQLQEVSQLLKSVIRHWTILGKTSVDGFRQSFLKREGKLIEAENHWKLMVDRKGYDVLLEKLPYPLSYVKLPWMNQPLYVEW